jgi:hypothetical protein
MVYLLKIGGFSMGMLNNQMVMDVKRTCADATGKPLFGGKNPFGEHSLEPIQ